MPIVNVPYLVGDSVHDRHIGVREKSCAAVKTPHLVQQCCLSRVLQTYQSWNRSFNKHSTVKARFALIWDNTYEALFDENAANSVDGLNAGNPSEYALFAFLRALLNSASTEVLNPTFPWNCVQVGLQVINLTCQTWEAGLFPYCRCCHRLVDQRPSAPGKGLPVKQDVMAEEEKNNSNKPLSSHSCTHWRALLWSNGEPGKICRFN